MKYCISSKCITCFKDFFKTFFT